MFNQEGEKPVTGEARRRRRAAADRDVPRREPMPLDTDLGVDDLLTGVLDTLDEGVVVIDSDLKIRAVNATIFDIIDVDEAVLRVGGDWETFVRYGAERGDYGPGAVATHVGRIQGIGRSGAPYERTRARHEGRHIQHRARPLRGGGIETRGRHG